MFAAVPLEEVQKQILEEMPEAVAVWEEEEEESFYDDTYPCGCCRYCGCSCDFEYEDMWIDEDLEDE